MKQVSGNRLLRSVYILFLLALFTTTARAQYANESELKKQAEKYFEDEDYANGYKAYSQLVSNYPKDPNYNYRLGVCMIYTEPDKKKCYPYLEFANKNIQDCEKEAKFYLAKAYHINFRFDDAIKLYNEYKAIASGSMAKKLQVDMEIRACRNGKKLLSSLNELVVLEKKQLAEGEYFRSYNLKDIGGKLLVKPSEYLTAADKKKKNKSIVYLPKSGDQLYYSSYGSGDNKDIYIVRRLPNGEWSKPQSMGAPINTEFDEDYPFLHPNGRVLYFASKGHNSMGGYDLFKSEFNESTQTWGQPINLDFPINTPNDDILFVTDSLEKTAYFSSTRQSPVGKIDVFKINTERIPPEFVYIKGTVLKQSMEQSVASKIAVKDISSGENLGTFQAGPDGNYLLKIPNGGKFIFTVETPGFPTQSEGINIPENNTLTPYKQAISYDKQTLVIRNYFETNKDDENAYKDYIEILEEKSKMDVNAHDFINASNNNNATTNNNIAGNSGNNNNSNNSTHSNGNNNTNTGNTNTNTNNSTGNSMNNQQLEQIAFSDAKELKEEASKLKSDANDAFTFVSNKKEEAKNKNEEALQAIEAANKETDPAKKQVLLEQADKLKEESISLDNQATLAETIAKQLDLDANNKQKEAELQQKYAQQLQEVNKSKNNKEALAKLEVIQKELNAISDQKSSTDDLTNSIKTEAARKDEEINKLNPALTKIDKEINDIKSEIAEVDKEISTTKDKALLENLNAQKEELNNDLSSKISEKKKTEDKLNALAKERDALNSQVDFASNMISEVKSSGSLSPISPGNNNSTISGSAINNTNNGNNNNGNNTSNGNNNSATDNSNSNNGNNSTVIANNNNNTDSNNGTGITPNNNTNNDSGNPVNNNNSASNNNSGTTFENVKNNFDTESNKINSLPESSGRYEQQNKLIDTYLAAIDKEITEKKAEAKKAKNNAEKTALNNKIKELEAEKSDKLADKKINDSKIAYLKTTENNAATVNNNNTNGNTTNAANNTGNNSNNNSVNNTTGNNNVTGTNNTNSSTGNNNPLNNSNPATANNNTSTNGQNSSSSNPELNQLTINAEAFTNPNEKELFNNNDFNNPVAASLKEKAELDYNNVVSDAANTAAKISGLQAATANNNNDQKNTGPINQLNTDAANLENEANNLRKQSAGLSGQEKQDNLNKIKELEMQAAYKKFEAAKLSSEDNNNEYKKNEQIISEYIAANGNKPNAAVTKANTLLNESKTFNNQAQRIKEEANAEPDIAAKSASFSNVQEKELLALQKQNEAIELLKKNNPSFKPSTENNAADAGAITAIKTELNKEEQQKNKALKDLAEANNQEYTYVANKLKNNVAKTNGSNQEILKKQEEAAVVYNEGMNLLSAANNTTSQKEKSDLLTQANQKLKQAADKVKDANKASEELISSGNIVSGNGNNTTNTNNTSNNNSTTTGNNNTNNNSTTGVNNNNNTSNSVAGNNSANNSTTTNENNVNNTGGSTNSDNTTNENNTAANTDNPNVNSVSSNTVTPATGTLTPAQIKTVQNSPEYKNYTNLAEETNKYEAIAKKENDKASNYYEQASLYLKESNDLRIQLDKLPAGEEHDLKQEQAIKLDRLANEYKAKGDSVRELANNTQAFADSKKMETEAYAQSLDPKTYENILIASGNKTNGNNNTASTGTTNSASNNTVTNNTGKYSEFSPAFRNNAAKFDDDLNSFNNAEENEANLSAKNVVLSNYNKAIDTEIANEKTKLTTASAPEKTQINQRITSLQNQKATNNKAIAANNNKIKNLNAVAGNNNTNSGANTNSNNTSSNTANNNLNSNNTSGNAGNTNSGTTASNNTSTTSNSGNNNGNTNNTSTAGASNNSSAGTSLNAKGITIKNSNAYSSANPIPIDEKLPDGIIFAVQIGAFKNPIPDDLFKGLSPLRGERTGTGLIRYQAGRFEKFENANAVRNDLKKLGYTDAFVVVYKDGQRISLSEAINELQKKGVTINNNPNESAGITVNSNVPTANTVSSTLGSGTNNNTNTTGNTVTPATVNPTQLNDMQGMLFTVQIGVYSNNVSNGQLYNLKPIYREQLPNGNYRYTAGIYNNIDHVKTDRAKVNALGINDAFVSAYQNGQRIKIADALAKINAGENIQFPPENPIQFDGAEPVTTNTTAVNPANTNTVTTNSSNNTTGTNSGNTTAPFTNGVSEGPQPTASNGVKTGDEGITFKIQIGAYKNQVPQNVANNFLKIKQWPIKANLVNGLYIYTIGSFVDAKSARPLLEEAKANGITDAYITVYKDGKKLYGDEASSWLTK